MEIPVQKIADIVGGRIDGDPDVLIHAPARIEEGKAGTITFLVNPKYEPFLYKTDASAVLVRNDFQPQQPVKSTLIRVDDVYASLGTLLNHFNHTEIVEKGVSEQAKVEHDVELGEHVSIGAFAVVSAGAHIGTDTTIYPQVFIGSNVRIGKGCKIYPGVRIYHDCQIGNECIIHANSVIGSDGFGFSKSNAAYSKIPQIGNVVLEDRVEIGANTVIDRATMGSTLIKAGVKLDNLIQIAHNVEVGKNTVMAAQSGVAGSSKIGAENLIGGQVGIAGHLHLADGVQIQAKSGVSASVNEPNAKIYGYPAIEYIKYLKAYAGFKQLPELIQKIKKLEAELERLKADQSTDIPGIQSEHNS